jgi:hypothetical protein
MILSPDRSGQTKFGLQPFQNQPLGFSVLDIGSPPGHIPTIMINATPQQLRKAADLQEKIQSLQEELAQLLGAPAQPPSRAPGKRKLSAQGLANIRAGVRKRIAAKAKIAPQPKRKFSAAGRARLAALAKARWAKARRAGRSRL